MLTLILSLLLTLASHAFTQDAIYNGTRVSADGQAWRNTVQLNHNGFMCTGVFVDYDLLVTAAHCDIRNSTSLQITLYRENDPSKAETIYLQPGEFRHAKHPGYNAHPSNGPHTNDIAIVTLKTKRLPYDGFRPAEFQTSANAYAANEGQTMYVIGSGSIGNGRFADRLFFAKGVVSRYDYNNVMVVNMNSPQGTCGGDSGGPVFASVNGHLVLSSIIHGTSERVAGQCGLTLYATVITAERYNWIQAEGQRGR